MHAVMANLLAKKQELSELLALKASLEKQLLAREEEEEEEQDDDDDDAPVARISDALPASRPLSAPPSDHPRARVPSAPVTPQRATDDEPPSRIPPNSAPGNRPSSAPPSDHPRGAEEEKSKELLTVLEHRRRAQQAVAEQERKIAELSALQERLRSRLADLELNENEDDEDEEEDDEEDDEEEYEDEEEEEPSEGITGEQLLQILSMKTRECQQLAAAVEQARESGMDERDPRLAQAEATLAYRYDEVKELAAIAARHGLSASDVRRRSRHLRITDAPRACPLPPPRPPPAASPAPGARATPRRARLTPGARPPSPSQADDNGYAEEEEARPLSSRQLNYEDDGYYEQQQALRKRWGQAQPPVVVDPHAAMQAMDDVQRLEEELQALATLPRAPSQPLASS